MRITQNMMSNVFISNLRRQTGDMLSRQEQIASQKRINRPSDDPLGMGRVLAGRSRLERIDQYVDNIKQGRSRLEQTELTLSLVDDLVRQARSLAEANSGAEITAEQRQLAAGQVKDIYDQVLQLANSTFGSRHMFAGHQTATAPFTRDAAFNAAYHGDAGSFRIPVADGVTVDIDANGENYFQAAAGGGVNIFDQLRDLITGLEDPSLASGTAQIRATVDPLQQAHQQITNKRSEGGPKLYRLQSTEQYWSSVKDATEAAIGRDEDADVARAIIELKNLETAYQSTMAAASRIIQPSLVDFLR
jgi:flagellar hook-associated protein 3 FlgL